MICLSFSLVSRLIRAADASRAFRRRRLFARAAPAQQTVRSDENIALCLAGVPRIEAVFRAHVGDDCEVLAARGETNDG